MVIKENVIFGSSHRVLSLAGMVEALSFYRLQRGLNSTQIEVRISHWAM